MPKWLLIIVQAVCTETWECGVECTPSQAGGRCKGSTGGRGNAPLPESGRGSNGGLRGQACGGSLEGAVVADFFPEIV